MYRIRLATGHETVFETVEDIARGVSTGTITPECAVFHAKAGKWLPIAVHPVYKQALAAAQEMAANPVRPKRISRPLPRVDTPSPERTSPIPTRVKGPDLASRGAPPPVEKASPAAHELSAEDSAAVAVDASDEDTTPPPAAAETQAVVEEEPEPSPVQPKLNDGLLDLGPIASAKAPPSGELIIEHGTPAPDADMPVTTVAQAEARTAPERTRRADPPPPAKVEPAPAPTMDPPPTDNKLDIVPNAAEPEAVSPDAPYKVPEGKPLKRAEGPLPIGAALGDFSDESKVDSMLPPPARDPERRVSGAQRAVAADQSGPHRRPPRERHDPFGRAAPKETRIKAPLIAAGFVGLLAVGWLLKSFVFAGTDPAEAATRNSASLAATSATSGASVGRAMPLPQDSLNDSAVVATVLDSLRMATASEALSQPAIETPSVSQYASAYQAARANLDISLAAIDVPGMLAPERWSTAAGAHATQLDVRAIRRALAAFRTREAEVEGLRAEGELSLRETTPQVRRADLMLTALDSLFGWMVSQAGEYVMVEDAMVFRGDSSQESTYRALKQRVLDEVYRSGAAPPSVAHIVQAMDSTLFPTSSSIPSDPSLPPISLPTETGSRE